MRNNILIFFVLVLCFCNNSYANQFIFKTSELEILENGNLVSAKNGTAISDDKDLELEAKKFNYLKNLNLLTAFEGVINIKSENLRIEFNQIEIDKENLTINANGNIKINDLKKELEIKTNSISYDKKTNILKSNSNSTLKDKLNNKFKTELFYYNLNDNILKIKNAHLRDFENNNFFLDIAYINTLTNNLIGKDIAIDLNNKSFNKENEPRLKGKNISYDGANTEIEKGVFTTCKKRDGKCPPWELSAEKIQHDKKNQIINYKNAWLKVYDIPVVYFPKFFHPDPTVERKSGFLVPTLKNSPNAQSYLSVPYYLVLKENKDITFTPRLYTEDKFLLQSEYRQENYKSSHISDFSYLYEKNSSSKSHFFYKLDKKIDLNNFEDSKLKLKIEKTSNDTYLKSNKLQSPIILSETVLENSLSLDMSSVDTSINTEFRVYESLDKKKSDRYEFILPKIEFAKKLKNKTSLNGDFQFNSNNFIKNYETNIFEKVNINDIIFNSNPKISKFGFYNNYDFIIKNVNSDSQNSIIYKKDQNHYLSGLFQFNSSLPLIKDQGNLQKILKPKLALKISPENTKDISNEETRLDANNIFNLNRISSSNTIEGGVSLAYGNDFTILNNKNNIEIFSLKLANNIRLNENDDLPKTNQIGRKTSNFFGEISYNPNDILKTKYNVSSKNNFTEVSYENLLAEISINNFVTTFDYLNENNTNEKNTYLKNKTTYNFNDRNNFSFSTRRNKKTNLTEYYNFIYQYKLDCLAASIEYNKDYYNDRDIKPEESIFFKLTIIPFGETSSPNLKN